MKLLDTFLEGAEYAAGAELTVADLTLVATVSTYEAVGFDLGPYPNILKWYGKVKEMPGYDEANGKNALVFKELFESLTKK